jgi:hypothetical protein
MKTVLLSGGKAKGRLALCAVPTYCSLQRLQHSRSGHNEHSESTVSTAASEEILIEDKKRTGGTWRFTCMSSEELKQGRKGLEGIPTPLRWDIRRRHTGPSVRSC